MLPKLQKHTLNTTKIDFNISLIIPQYKIIHKMAQLPRSILGLIYAFNIKRDYYNSILVCKLWNSTKASCKKAQIMYAKNKTKYDNLERKMWWLSMESLRELSFVAFNWVECAMSNDDIKYLCNLRKLENLTISWNVANDLKYETIAEQMSKLVNLKIINLGCIGSEGKNIPICNMDGDRSWLESLEMLESLQLNNYNLYSLKWLKSLKRVDELCLKYCYMVVRSELNYIEGLYNLKKLFIFEIGSKYIMDDEIMLVFLKMNWLNELRVNSLGINRINFEGIGKNVNLKKLDLSYSRNIRIDIKQLRHFVNLKELDISSCLKISVEDLCNFNINLGLKLEKLYLCSCNVTNIVLKNISLMQGLIYLKINACPVDNEGISYLANLTSLQELNISYCELINNDGLIQLKGLTNLRTLGIINCTRITKKCLNQLVGINIMER